MAKKLPKILYVKRENPNTPDEFLLPAIDPTELAEPDSTISVGVYELKRMVLLENKTVIQS